jgi:hypothetical protein
MSLEVEKEKNQEEHEDNSVYAETLNLRNRQSTKNNRVLAPTTPKMKSLGEKQGTLKKIQQSLSTGTI